MKKGIEANGKIKKKLIDNCKKTAYTVVSSYKKIEGNFADAFFNMLLKDDAIDIDNYPDSTT